MERRDEMRSQSVTDHDMLTRIDANLSNFMRRFDDHAQSDEENFERLYRKVGFLQKALWIATGAVAGVELMSRFFR